MEEDLVLNCKDCSSAFSFSAGEQRFYAARNFLNPVRCPGCRAARKAAGPRGPGNQARAPRREKKKQTVAAIQQANEAPASDPCPISTLGEDEDSGIQKWWKGDFQELKKEERQVIHELHAAVGRTDASHILSLMDVHEENLTLLQAGCCAFCSLPSTKQHLMELAAILFKKVLNGTINTKLCAGLVAVTEGFMPQFNPGFWNSFFAYFLQFCQDMMSGSGGVEALKLEEEKRIAFAMVLHNRVGAPSTMKGLNGDLVCSILENAEESVRRQRTLLFQELLVELLRSKAIGSACIKIVLRQQMERCEEMDVECILEFISKAGTLLDKPRFRMRMDLYLDKLISIASNLAQQSGDGGLKLSKKIHRVVSDFKAQRGQDFEEEQADAGVSNIMKINLKIYH